MTDKIAIEYRGREITWSENEDEWRCWAIEYSSPKLSSVKRKIDTIDARKRKVSCAVVVLSDWNWTSRKSKPGSITSLVKGRDGSPSGDAFVVFEEEEVCRGEKRTVKVRRKIGAANLGDPAAPDFEEKLAAFEAAVAAEAAATAARRFAFEAIPRLTLEKLKTMGVSEDEAE